MLTLSQTFTDAFSTAEVEPVLLVQIWTTTTASQAYCTGSRRLAFDGIYNPFTGGTITGITAAPSVANVSPLAIGLDPFERTIERNHLSVTFHDDGALRDFVVANRIIGQTVTVKLGTADMKADADWAQVFRGMVEGVKPREGQIDLVCSDTFRFLDRPYQGNWLNRHPLQAIKKVIDECGTPSDLVDSSSMDPANHSDIGHYVVNYWNLTTDVRQGDFVEKGPLVRCHELARAMVGSLFIQENGVAKFLRFDPAATVRANWGVDDIRDFEQLDSVIINEIEATVTTRHEHAPGDSDSVAVFAKDSTSQTNFAGPGESTRAFNRSVEFDLEDLQAVQSAGSDITTTGACSLDVGTVAGLPGTRVTAGYTTGSWAHPSEAVLSSSRPAYLLINDEVMKATASTSTAEVRYDKREYDAAGTNPTVTTVPGRAVFTVDAAGRGQMGTTAAYHQVPTESPMAGAVTDVTMAHDFAAVQLQRFSNGCPSVSVTTSLREWAVQVGDLVTLDGIDVFLDYTFDGVGTSVKWEVTSKELRLDDNAAEILWTLVYATQTSPQAINQAFTWPDKKPGKAGASRSAGHCYFVVSGLQVTATSGVVVSVAAGTAGLGATGAATSLHAARSLTMLSSRDTYIDYNVDGGSLGVMSEANGAQEPELYPGNVRLAKVVTGGSAVTSVTDLRRFGRTTPDAIAADDFEAGANQVHNPAFTSWACGGGFPPDLWEVGDTSSATWGTSIERDSVQYYRGAYSVRIDGTGFSKRLKSKAFRVEPGRVYMLGGAVRAASSSSTVKVGVVWLDSDGAQVGSTSHGVTGTGFGSTWKESHGAVTAHADAAQASVVLYYETTGSAVWFDQIRMVRAWPNFHAEANASTTVNSGTGGTIALGLEKHDVGGNFAAGYFIAPHDGFYKFSANVQATAASTPVTDSTYGSVVFLTRWSGDPVGTTVTTIAEGIGTDNSSTARWQFTINTGSVELLAGDRVYLSLSNGTNRTLTVNYSSGQTWMMGEQTS